MTARPHTPQGWEGLLAPSEVILWQGRPDGALAIDPRNLPQAAFGVLFAGFALFWMVMAAQAGGLFWAFGLIHLGVGLAVIAHALVWPVYRRRRTWYTLTNLRAIVATDLPLMGKRLKSYPITADTVLTFDDAPLASIGFAFEPVRTKRRTRMRMVGFERIPDGRAVYALMRGIQTRPRQAGLPEDGSQ